MARWHHDFRSALRSITRRPALAAVTILVLALGIGVNTAVFTVVDAVLLRPLPVDEPERLVKLVLTRADRGGHFGVRFFDYREWRDASRSFTALAALRHRHFAVLEEGESRRIAGVEVTPGYFDALGVEPVLGRALTEGDLESGERLVVLSHAWWRRGFGSDPSVLGRSIVLDREPYIVIGVMPPATEIPELGWGHLWTLFEAGDVPVAEQSWELSVLGRLAPGISLDDARRDLDAVAARLADVYPATHENLGVEMHPVRWWIFGSVRKPLFLVYAVSALVLLVACGTVSNLAFSRAVERRREMAVRKALGAPAGRLLCQLLAESVVFALVGGLLGLALAWAGVEVVPEFVPDVPRIEEAGLGLRVLAAMFAVSLVAGAASGLAPTLALARASATALADREGIGSRGGRRVRGLLVAAQTSLAVVAVIGAGLLLRSLGRLEAVELGFEPGELLTLKLELPEDGWPDKEARIVAMRELLGRIEALPGVASAGATGLGLPLESGRSLFEIYLEGHPRGPRPDVIVLAQMVSSGFLEAMDMKLVAGRWFEPGETWETARAVVVNETLARRYWPGQEPVGRWMEWQTGERGYVVGVVGDVRQEAIHLEASAEAYLAWGSAPGRQTVVVRTALAEPRGLLAAIRGEAAAVFPGVPVHAVATGAELVRETYAPRRLWTLLMSVFAVLALGLGLVGLYGVTAHSVAGRTREIGIRMAIGAWPRSIVCLVVGRGLAPVAGGIFVGLALAAGSTRLLESQLYGVPARDPATFLVAAALVLAAAAAICGLPARRAARVDPAVAVRAPD